MRGGQYKLFRYPAPANEDTNYDNSNMNNFRTPYQYSIHNVRRNIILNKDHEKILIVGVYGPSSTLAEKMVDMQYLPEKDKQDEAKINKACEEYIKDYGIDPRHQSNLVITVAILSNGETKFTDTSGLLSNSTPIEQRRAAMRSIFSSALEEAGNNQEGTAHDTLPNLYRQEIVTTQPWDMTSWLPEWRQMRIQAIQLFEDRVQLSMKDSKVKVYKGNPRRNWQVLDDSFDQENREIAQGVVKDSRSASIGLPEANNQVSLSQRRRSGVLMVDVNEEDSYVQLPIRSQHIK